MSSAVRNRLFAFVPMISLMLLGWSAPASARSDAISEYFPVCMKPLPGVTIGSHVGIDAAEGKIAGQGGVVDFMISHNPGLPAAMKAKFGGKGPESQRLKEGLELIAESEGPLQIDSYGKPIGYGTERLYGLSKGDLDTPRGPIQEKIYIQLWVDRHEQNVRLLRMVGNALYRCH